jgi:hypothetical protein
MGWLRRMRGTVGMGLTWAIFWALAGIAVGVVSFLVPAVMSGPFFRAFDAPLPALALPGFFGGLFFSAVLRIAGGRRKFAELSLPKFTAWGAAGGFLLSLFPAALIALRLAHPAPGVSGMSLFGVAVVPFMLLGAGSAAATLGLARAADRRGREMPVEESVGAG